MSVRADIPPQIIQLHKKYGPIFRFDYGIPTVFIGDYDLALEAYNGDACNSRPLDTIPGYKATVDLVCSCLILMI